MQKLILEHYTEGDSLSTVTTTYTLEYVSKSELTLDLEIAILWFHENKGRIAKNLQDLRVNYFEKQTKEISQEEHCNFIEKCADLEKQRWIVVGDMLIEDNPYWDISINDFSIFTFDEYFVIHSPEKVN